MPIHAPVPQKSACKTRCRPAGGTRAAWVATALLGALLGLGALAGMLWAPSLGAAPSAAAHPPPGYHAITLEGGPRTVWDGDTFDADLDGDGRLDLPRERVRLLFVDTPELSESRKGKDPVHGMPAREFLAAALQGRPLVLYVPTAHPTGNYGRTLALVLAGGEDVNLSLIRAGHSYFDTRFSFPPDPAAYAAYAAAEGEAFDARRGIWRDAPSRNRYLKRLKTERKTPSGKRNKDYAPTVQDARTLDAAAFLNRYVRVEGVLAGTRHLRKDVRLLELEGPPGRPPLPVVAFSDFADRLGVDSWAAGTRLRLEGFVQVYQQHLELVLHYGASLPPTVSR
jgi:endonuclease YncB( thermonuclease family)